MYTCILFNIESFIVVTHTLVTKSNIFQFKDECKKKKHTMDQTTTSSCLAYIHLHLLPVSKPGVCICVHCAKSNIH